MAIACNTEQEIEDGDTVFADAGTRNVVRVRVVSAPAYLGRRVVDAYRTIWYRAGILAIGDYESGDAAYIVPVHWMPFTLYLPAGFAGGVTYSGVPGLTLGVKFCTV